MPGLLQLVGTVFINSAELRVMAPADAVGDSLSWLEHCRVRTQMRRSYLGGTSEVDADPGITGLALEAMRAELEKGQSGGGSSGESGQAPYYHVLVHTTKEPKIEAKFDLRRDELVPTCDNWRYNDKLLPWRGQRR